ncbi:hypothetical protein AKO1_004896, partial [Acrasis kona]
EKDGTWNYYVDPSVPSGKSINSTLLYGVGRHPDVDSFPNPFVVQKQSDTNEILDPWTPVVIKGSIDSAMLSTDAKYTALYTPYWEENFGHFLHDDMFSVFDAMLQFHANYENPSDLQLLVNTDCEMFGEQRLERCNKFHQQWIPLFSSHPVIRVDTLEETKCYQNLFVGLTSFNFHRHHHTGKGLSRWLFRNHILQQLNYKQKTNKRPIITIIDKVGRRRIMNTQQIALHLYNTLNDVDVNVVSNVEKLSPYMQVELMQKTTVLISPPGGISMMSIFLNEGSSAIFTDIYDPETRSSKSLEGYFWSNMHHINHLRYRVSVREVVFDKTSESRGSTNQEVYRNYGNVLMDNDKTLNLALIALNYAKEYKKL